ncbi:eukaryotic translation initiation factor 3 subunit J [Copidosoma floridanum]|uniref:eukaryotic translation initiation factor 3 subunit J n=1 Tax=Copidosoma floridanum TaxID=29053 RepID=UPI0006C9B954|nr:eukaryotic translation initiation factor 3 subunit J [Copidosoma floridanum]
MDDWEEKINEEPRFEMPSNKWEGEDEDEDVLDSWEDINEEKKDVEKPPEAPKTKPKPKKTLQEKIEEKERKAREEAERKAKEKEDAMTPEERRAEMLRRQKLQEEADLRLAMETFGVTEGLSGIDAMVPTTADEFKELHDALISKFNQLNKHAEFPSFAEELIKNICITLSITSLRKVKTTVESLHNEKLKMEKEKVKKSKGKGKAKLKVEGDSEYGDLAAYDANDYDDFM